MTRSIDSTLLATLTEQSGHDIVHFIELQFSGGTVRATTAPMDLVWNTFTWEALGGLLDVDGFAESFDMGGIGARLRLSGVDQSILAILLSQNFRGRRARVWYAKLTPADGTVTGTPLLMFDGLMNEGWSVRESRGDFGGGTVDLSTKLLARINDLIRVRGIRCNLHSHQQQPISGVSSDTFFQNTAQIPGRKIYWGQKTPYLAPAGSGTPGSPGTYNGIPTGNAPAPPTNTFGTNTTVGGNSAPTRAPTNPWNYTGYGAGR